MTSSVDLFTRDKVEANRLSFGALVLRHARALRALRTVWASRRAIQRRFEVEQWMSRDLSRALDAAKVHVAELEAERDKARRGAETLGAIVDRQCRAVLDATGMHHVIDADGDGDWALVWERLADLGADRARLDRVRAALADHPRCDVHPDDDVIKCGWERAFVDVQRAMETTR